MSNPYLAKLEVTRITPVSTGNVKATASVKLGQTLTINLIKVIQMPGKRAFVQLPHQKSGDGNGWLPIVEALDEAFAEAIRIKVMDAWQSEG